MRRNRALVVAALALVLTASVGGAFIRLLRTRGEDSRRRAALEAATTRAYALEKELDRAAAAAYAASVLELSDRTLTSSGGPITEIKRHFPIVWELSLVPGEIKNPDALRSLETKRVVLSAPVSEDREGLVLNGYLPVFRSGRLSHFVLLVVRLQDVLGLSDLRNLHADGFDYSLERSDPRGNRPSLISRSTELILRDPVTVAIAAPGGEWKLSAVPRQGWRPAPTGREAAMVTLASLLVALFVYDLLRRPERLEREVQVRAQRLVETNRKLMTEMTERERAEELARHEATHDQLTGLANRPHFLMRVSRLQERADVSENFAYSVIVVNLDRFKSVNDSLGAAAADKVLIQVARRLEGALRPEDMVARVAGDEFAILLFDSADVLSVSHIASRIQEQLQRRFEFAGEEVFLTASIGIAFSATGYSEPEQPLRDAHLAMQSAKEEGGARQLIFDKLMRDQAITLSNIERELRPALERNEMRVFYQPIVSLETGRVTGFEALIRWKHPQRGFISPGLFLPVAEATGLVLQLDRWVLREALREINSLNQKGNHFSISVNLSGKQFSDAELGSVVAQVLADSGLAPELLRLEITESVMMRNAQSTLRTLQQLKKLNLKISLDDFGTGYSSLSYIREFPLDVLKIDRSFVSKMTENPRDEEIVRVILGLAGTLGLQVVAEGVETAEHLAHLRALRCDYGQGYLFAKPIDAEALAAFLSANPHW
jgi:diguanylate cyclase (GGDEF)-like protein